MAFIPGGAEIKGPAKAADGERRAVRKDRFQPRKPRPTRSHPLPPGPKVSRPGGGRKHRVCAWRHASGIQFLCLHGDETSGRLTEATDSHYAVPRIQALGPLEVGTARGRRKNLKICDRGKQDNDAGNNRQKLPKPSTHKEALRGLCLPQLYNAVQRHSPRSSDENWCEARVGVGT